MNKKQLENVIRYAKTITLANNLKLLVVPEKGIAGKDLFNLTVGELLTVSNRFVFGTDINDDYTLTVSDAGKYIDVTKSTAVTVTVPKDTFTEGDIITIEQNNEGQVTIAPVDGDVTLTGGLKTFDRYNVVQLVFKSANIVNVIGGTNE